LVTVSKAYCQNDARYYLNLSTKKLNDFSIPKTTRQLQALHLAYMAVSLDTSFADAYYMRGVCNRELGNLDKSIDDFNKVIMLEPLNYFAYACRGDIKFRQNDISGSIEDYTIVLKNDPNHEVYLWRGRVFFAKGDFQNATNDFTQVINQQSPWSSEAYYLRALSKFNVTQYDDCLTDLDSALALKIRNGDSLEVSKIHFQRGLTNAELMHYQESIRIFSIMIEANSKDSSAYYYRGMSHWKLGNHKQACSDWENAKSLNFYLADNAIGIYCR